MKEELSAWNGGGGIDLRSWVSCSGPFRLATGYAGYFRPEFELVEGYIVRAGVTPDSVKAWEESTGGDRRSAEAAMNHTHLIDINCHDQGNLAEDILPRFGSVLAEIDEAKLKWQFPDRPCAVRFLTPEDPSQSDGYVITLWQKSDESRSAEPIASRAIAPTPRQGIARG